jgi:peptidoglycan/xylan/chitin deacetylase (PgdA/CDA1 family)
MGHVVVSLDAELAWGFHDRSPLTDATLRRVKRGRRMWIQLLDLFDTYDVAATWAVVGHLLVRDREYTRPHPLPEERFAPARKGLRERRELWLGDDLIETVASADADHELASHSFSHAEFPDVDREAAAAECRLARDAGDELGFEFDSFVFPRNKVAHRDVLADAGFRCYRGVRPNRMPQFTGSRGIGMLTGSLTGRITPPAVSPHIDEHGLVNVPTSMFLGGFRGRPWSILGTVSGDPAVRLAKRGIDRTIRRDRVFHLWLHPHDLADSEHVERVRKVLEYIDAKREEGVLQTATMGEIAATVLGPDAGTPRPELEVVSNG